MERGEIRFDGPDRRAHGPRRPPAPGLPRHRRRRADLGRRCSRSRPPTSSSSRASSTGSGYGLLALGLVLVYRTNRVLNFAQGQIGVIAAVFLVKLTGGLPLQLLVRPGALRRAGRARRRPRPSSCCAGCSAGPACSSWWPPSGLSYVLLALTALPFIRPSNLYKPVPVPFDLSFSLGPFIITPDRGAHPHRRPHRDRGPGAGRPLHLVGAGHARHVGERRLRPALGRVDPPHLHADLDGGRRALGLHRHPQRARTRPAR